MSALRVLIGRLETADLSTDSVDDKRKRSTNPILT